MPGEFKALADPGCNKVARPLQRRAAPVMGWQRGSCRRGLGLQVSRRACLVLSKAIFMHQTGPQPNKYMRQQLSNQ
ncbi:hypothetical protein [Polaromonas sp.]|jgi:hypothetical protein|uniref:hypothetical protein n=1 Tax=Polaromonas sp. TaxID=1869339 RepID=UPI002CB93384|nr:hypothetical protein [Polaromonas sp.]HQS31851.1 hypothetical protein [Polaromonas sp.]HQS92440.1 hypothetical protein [Polaromonas sp.]